MNARKWARHITAIALLFILSFLFQRSITLADTETEDVNINFRLNNIIQQMPINPCSDIFENLELTVFFVNG